MRPIEHTIAIYIADHILFRQDGYPYSADASFLDNGIVDSVNILELVMFVEENFAIVVEDDEIIPENFDSVFKLARFVQLKKVRLVGEGEL